MVVKRDIFREKHINFKQQSALKKYLNPRRMTNGSQGYYIMRNFVTYRSTGHLVLLVYEMSEVT